MAWLADSQAIRGEKHKATRIEEAVTRGTLIEHLISDAGQMAVWPMKSCLQKADPQMQVANNSLTNYRQAVLDQNWFYYTVCGF